ncbi:MAG TPA: FAD-dependent oxidoreductase [Casimicrobiaceae bacterium]|nr:FAD-dependent oxidoreductase [Casimicrobiaceae bacterium]
MRVNDAARITIVGGGFSGASVAVQLARTTYGSLSITIVEPRPEPGYGSAYSSVDPDHRLNGIPAIHLVDPADPEAFVRWCATESLATRDPDAVSADGRLFVRRREFGRFLADSVERASQGARDRLRITHVRSRAVDVVVDDGYMSVATDAGARLRSDLLVIATGNAQPRLPASFPPALADHPAIIGSADDLARIRAIDAQARVLVLGTGLTALDVISTMVRGGHGGTIVAVSRRGLRPRPYRPPPPEDAKPVPSLLERIDGPVAPFVLAAGNPPAARALLHALRARIREANTAGDTWYGPFDELRDPLWQVWSRLDAREKSRILRHARQWYDVHRFRAPPQNDAIVRAAERRGIVQFHAARIRAVEATDGGQRIRVTLLDHGADETRSNSFDAVVNCTGLDSTSGLSSNPFLVALARAGYLIPDPSGLGIAVDRQCRPIGVDGGACDRMRVVGPPTAGAFGDPLGAIFIAAQIRRTLPGMLASLTAAPRTPG